MARSDQRSLAAFCGYGEQVEKYAAAIEGLTDPRKLGPQE